MTMLAKGTNIFVCEYCKYFKDEHGYWCGPWYDEDWNLKWHEVYNPEARRCTYWEMSDEYDIEEDE